MRWILAAVLFLMPAGFAYAGDANPGLAPGEIQEGFVSLFDGQTLDGWQGAVQGYTLEDGALVCKPGGNLFTAKEYANFILRFQFKLPPGGNNGVGIRTPLRGDPAYVGMEIQILDDGHPKYKDLKPYQRHGSIYGVVPANRDFLSVSGKKRDFSRPLAAGGRKCARRQACHFILTPALKPVGEWNEEEIVADGSRIKVTLNGHVIVDADLKGINKTMDGREHPGLHNAKGYIGWLGHGDPVAFRHIRIKELP